MYSSIKRPQPHIKTIQKTSNFRQYNQDQTSIDPNLVDVTILANPNHLVGDYLNSFQSNGNKSQNSVRIKNKKQSVTQQTKQASSSLSPVPKNLNLDDASRSITKDHSNNQLLQHGTGHSNMKLNNEFNHTNINPGKLLENSSQNLLTLEVNSLKEGPQHQIYQTIFNNSKP